MSALVDVLTVGYVSERVAGTVTLLRDNDRIIVVDPGMVAARSLILDPLRSHGIEPGQVTDIVLSHHHLDHTINVGLFPQARVHDFQATYVDDQWIDHEPDFALTRHIRLLATPGHTREDLTTLVETDSGLVALTHLWWAADGPAEDPFAPDREQLAQERIALLARQPITVIPGHGAPFAPSESTPV